MSLICLDVNCRWLRPEPMPWLSLTDILFNYQYFSEIDFDRLSKKVSFSFLMLLFEPEQNNSNKGIIYKSMKNISTNEPKAFYMSTIYNTQKER